MITPSYRNFCERLWKDWLNERLDISLDLFKCESAFAPEPYLRFDEGKSPLYVLFTNPGGAFTDADGAQVQKRDEIKRGKSCISPDMSYHEAALEFAKYYCEKILPPNSACTRIKSLQDLKQRIGADCIVQFESLPFHSPRLPNKRKLPDLIANIDGHLKEYVQHLKVALNDISVVGLSAVNTSKAISTESVAANSWLSWQASYLLGIDPNALSMQELVNKNGQTTSAFLYQKIGHCIRGIVLTMGGNNFPGEEGRIRLAETLNGY